MPGVSLSSVTACSIYSSLSPRFDPSDRNAVEYSFEAFVFTAFFFETGALAFFAAALAFAFLG